MKLWILSDLHLSVANALATSREQLPAAPEADVCVMAGDICDGLAGMDWVGRVFSDLMPIVVCLGNHDFYGEDITGGIQRAKEIAARYPNFHLLADSEITIGDIRFVGGTMWTDFELFADDDDPISSEECRRQSKSQFADFSEIYAVPSIDGRMGRLFTPKDSIFLHNATRSYLDTALQSKAARRTVVLTHHAPSRFVIPQRFDRDPKSAAFASDLTKLIVERRPDVWVHGHVHDVFDYNVGETRVICNPRGYPKATDDDGETNFNPKLVIEV